MNLHTDHRTDELADHLNLSQCMEQQSTEHIDKKEMDEIIMAAIKYATLMRKSWHVETGLRVWLKTVAALVTRLSGSTSQCTLGGLPLPEKKCIKIEWASGSLLSNNACDPCLPLNTANVSDWDLERFQILILSDGWSVGQFMPHDSVAKLNHSSICCVLPITFHSEANAQNKWQRLYV